MERSGDRAMEPWLEQKLLSGPSKLPSHSFVPPAPIQLGGVLARNGSKSRALYGHCWDQRHFCLIRIPSAVVAKLSEQTLAALTNAEASRPKVSLGRCRWTRDEAGEKGHPSRRSAGVEDDRTMVVLDVLMPRDADDGEPVEVLRSMSTLFPRRPTGLPKDAPIPWLGLDGSSQQWLGRGTSSWSASDPSDALASASASLTHFNSIEMAKADRPVKNEPLSLPPAAQRPAQRPQSGRRRQPSSSPPPKPRRPSRADHRWDPHLPQDRRFGADVDPAFSVSNPSGDAWLAQADLSTSAAQASLPSPKASSSPTVERPATGPSTIQRNGYNTPGDTVHDGSDPVSDGSVPNRLFHSPSVSPAAVSPVRVGGQELTISRPPPARQPVSRDDDDAEGWVGFGFSQVPDGSLETAKTSTGSFCRRITTGHQDGSASPSDARSSSSWDEEALQSQDLSPYALKQRLLSRAEDVVEAVGISDSGDESAKEVAERLTAMSSPTQVLFAKPAPRRPFRKPVAARKSAVIGRPSKGGGFMDSDSASEGEAEESVALDIGQGSVAPAGFQRAAELLGRTGREPSFAIKDASDGIVEQAGEDGARDDGLLKMEMDGDHETDDAGQLVWQADRGRDGSQLFEPDGAKLFADSPPSPPGTGVAETSDPATDEKAGAHEGQTGDDVHALPDDGDDDDDARSSRPAGREPAPGPRTALRTAARWAAEIVSPEPVVSVRSSARTRDSATSASLGGWPALSNKHGVVAKACPIPPIVTLAEADKPCIASPPAVSTSPKRTVEDVESVGDSLGRPAKRLKKVAVTYSTATPEASSSTTRWVAGWTRNKLFARLRHYRPPSQA